MAKFNLTTTDVNKWKKNAVRFLLPVVGLYVVSVSGVIMSNDGAFSPEYLIPSTFVLGGVVLYILNTGFDILTKWSNE